ncbi:hypothetical protein GCM10010399_65220 [Dactylosporangium fulvum]|uniref:PQQ-like beta-propeller repeat protein n=1 Tax=Dactylosporangium fulvum TaxID=53359 RepID=A0ABY5VP97_9ACTN|nr:PQQ-binding-like beta-propeller repeat protein [Dactylosporangium fulvum]UWP78861.1 PQQ-like beta-propeller repeat protein [Dactylosporangium fulvum]
MSIVVGDGVHLPSGDLARTGGCPGPGVVNRPRVRLRLAASGAGPALPTVAGGVAYLGDAEGRVQAVDTASGGTLWQHRHELRHEDGSAALSAVAALPAVTGDLVFVEAGEQVFAHDRRTGRVRWRIPEISSHHGAVAGDVLLVLHDLHTAAAYDAATGDRRWRVASAPDGGFGLLASFPMVAGGRMFLTEGFEGNHTHGGLHAVDLDTGALLWGFHDTQLECERPGCEGDDLTVAPNHPVYARGLVWVVRGRWCGADGTASLELVGFDPQTGREHVALAEPDGVDVGDVFGAAPVFGPDLVYCPSGQGLHALDPATGHLRWSRRFAAPVVGTPLLAGRTLHLAVEGGQLHAVDAGTGESRWDLTLDEPTSWSADAPGEYDEVATPLTLAGGVLYVATDSAVLALS